MDEHFKPTGKGMRFRMLISDYIAAIIEEMLNEGGGKTEVKRNDLAARVGCVPSQINYVITSRFTPEKGYTTESRRGGGGYIRIARVKMTADEYLMHFFHAIGDTLDEGEARAYIGNLSDRGLVNGKEAKLIKSAICAGALDKLPQDLRNHVRADIMRHIIISLMN